LLVQYWVFTVHYTSCSHRFNCAVLTKIGGSTAAVLGYGALASVVMGAWDFTGSKLTGYERKEDDEFKSYVDMRQNRRRPIEETIAEIGEGRGRILITS
jgi:hypothetical protein